MALSQLVVGVDAGGDGDDGCGVGARGEDIGGSVADETNSLCRMGEQGASFSDGASEDVLAQLGLVTKAAETEIMPDAGGFELGPGDGFEIPRGNAQELAFSIEMLQQSRDGGAEFGIESRAVALGFAAHDGERGFQ